MGVPKFYRWLSERYPCLSQVIKEHQIPEFDNLYLDMNGIIHPCSHPNDDDPHFRISEAQIFKNIFNYIEVLFRIIKPKQNFFMAVDGCAPRAKMNQQRSRRFRTSKEAEEAIRKALQKGQKLPKEERFDSNCITPGTEFMTRLQHQLKYFVNMKISSDPLWQQCNVYLSGHDVPGEGEHKVMDFIRYCKSEHGYDPNTRHCLYGLDADLVMLGLSSHEPHFCLLREEVRFGRQAKRLTRPEEQTFHLLHLSLLREYLDMEFRSLEECLHFRYDSERLIDDWIFLGFLVGNDFVPHLPHMHINHDALPYLYKTYKSFVVTTDGYLNDGGFINLHRLKKFFDFLSKFDRDRFEELYADLKWLESKGSGKLLAEAPDRKKVSEVLRSLNEKEEEELYRRYEIPYSDKIMIDTSTVRAHRNNLLTLSDDDDVNRNDDDIEIEDEETFELEFKQHKRQYYMEKFSMDVADSEHIQTICNEYVIALQWIAHYYFNGLQSWSWYYPYHYSPYISDVADFDIKEISLEMGEPFHPFEQLLAVLPAASRKLLPEAFRGLMSMDNSPIIDYYPADFQTDLNGKQQEWEAVVLIPFIDENRLLKAMEPNYLLLDEEERSRNAFGVAYKYTYNKTLNFVYPSVHPDFGDITTCCVGVEEISRDLHHLEINEIKKGLMKGTKLDVYFQGFPTMKHLKFESFLSKAGVKVFQHHSRSENMIIKILHAQSGSIEDVAKRFVGEVAYVEWPYMAEAMVTSVSNDHIRYYLGCEDELCSKLIQGQEYSKIKRDMKEVSTQHMEKRGIKLGDVQILLQAKLLLGKRYICGAEGIVRLEKEWSQQTHLYALQTVVQDISVNNLKHDEYDSVGKLFPKSSMCFMVVSPYYGSSGEVIEFDQDSNRVRVALTVVEGPNFFEIMCEYDSMAVQYLADHAVAQRMGISVSLLGRVTGNIFIDMSNNQTPSDIVNVGLKLKYSGQNKEASGYARRSPQGWAFSSAAVSIILRYITEFPELFEALGLTNAKDNYKFSKLLPKKNQKYIDKIKAFLKAQPSYKCQLVPCGNVTLDEPVVQAVERAVEKAKLENKSKCVKVKVKPHLLFRPTEQFGKLTPDPSTEFLLLDRVVNVQNGISVPLGMRGTIIGMQQVLSVEGESEAEQRLEVLFDDAFLGLASSKRTFTLMGNSLLNISYGERKSKEKKGLPTTTPMVFQSKISNKLSAMSISAKYSPNTPGIIHTNAIFPSYGKQRKEEEPSPGYWLKGSYGSPSSGYTPVAKSNWSQSSYKPRNSNTSDDFMNIWQELQKVEDSKQKTNQPSKATTNTINKDATAAVHQLLHLQKKKDDNIPKSTSQEEFHAGSSTSSPRASSIAQLQQLCVKCNLPSPQYIYSSNQQGICAVVVIGSIFRVGGSISPSQQLAAEAAANLALIHMSQLYPLSPVGYSFAPVAMAPIVGQQRQLYQSPRNFYHNKATHQSQSMEHLKPAIVMPQKSKSYDNAKTPVKNLFVPHQVLVKSLTPSCPSTNDVADTQIKDILGIKSTDNTLKDILGIKTKPQENQTKNESENLKLLLGITKDEVVTTQTMEATPKVPPPVSKPSTGRSKNQILLAPSFFNAKKN